MNEYVKNLNKSVVEGMTLKTIRPLGKSVITKELGILSEVYKYYTPKLILGKCLIDDKLKFTKTNDK